MVCLKKVNIAVCTQVLSPFDFVCKIGDFEKADWFVCKIKCVDSLV